jgi:hypothetical protein
VDAASVVTFSVANAGLALVGVTEPGVTVHVAFEGQPETVKETVELKLPCALTSN